jgi:hypothetical protein
MEYIYTSFWYLENIANVDVSDINEDYVKRELVRKSSELVNMLTQQIFNPMSAVKYLNGKGDDMVAEVQAFPIIKINSLQNKAGQEYTDLDLDYIELTAGDRIIVNTQGDFNEGVRNVVLDAIFGWLEDRREIVTTTEGAINSSTEEVAVEDASELQSGDVFVIGKHTFFIYGFGANNVIKFDKNPEIVEEIDAGATIEVFGRVPKPIQELTNYLLEQAVLGRKTGTTSTATQTDQQIKREETVDYKIEFFENKTESSTVEVSETSLSDPVMDSIVRKYSKPPFVGVI